MVSVFSFFLVTSAEGRKMGSMDLNGKELSESEDQNQLVNVR